MNKKRWGSVLQRRVGEDVVEKSCSRRCREELEKSVVEMSWRRVLQRSPGQMSPNSVVEISCREVL